jgi:hypothetical protein
MVPWTLGDVSDTPIVRSLEKLDARVDELLRECDDA